MAPRSTCTPAARSASSANPAAAKASPRARSCASSSGPAASSAARSCCGAANGQVVDLVDAARRRRRRCAQIRGGEIGLVFQEPMSSLSAFHTVGNQLIEAIRLHSRPVARRPRATARSSCWRMVGIPRPGATRRCVFVRTVRRPAAARDDRPGAGRRSAPADRRRADHGAGRDHAGADPGPDRGGCSRNAAWR